jgi:pimeloyl-ACP methyl ester carboxylesterase
MSVPNLASHPTVVLVHGAYADASSWNGVIAELQDAGTAVLAPSNPLRGLVSDSEYITSFVSQIDGPVVLVGHSYGGAVISVAGAQANNVVGLVFVAAFLPEVGESIAEAGAGYPDTKFTGAARPAHYPIDGSAEPAVELTVAPEIFPGAFAADLPEDVTRVLAVSQRPLALAGVEQKATAAAWKTLKTWAIVATKDEMIHPDAERAMAVRAGATTTEIDGSHAIAVSQPAAVAAVIRTAVEALAPAAEAA